MSFDYISAVPSKRNVVVPVAVLAVGIVVTAVAPILAVWAAILVAIILGTTSLPLTTMGVIIVLVPIIDQCWPDTDAGQFSDWIRFTSGTGLKAITALVIASYFWRRRINPWRHRVLRIPLIFVAYTLLLCFRFHSPATSLSIWLRATYWIGLLVFFYVVAVHEANPASKVLRLWAAGLAALVIFAASVFLSKAMGATGGFYGIGEAYGFYDAPWNMAMTLPTLITLPMACTAIKARSRGLVVTLCCALVVCTLMATYMTMVRTSLAACIAAVFAFGLVLARTGSGKAIAAGVLALTICVGTVCFLHSGVTRKDHTQIADRWSETEDRGDIGSGRLLLWYAGYSHFRAASIPSKILGEGFGTGPEAAEEYLGYYMGLHSDVIEVILASGIAGLILYSLAFVRFYREARIGLRQGTHWGLAAILVLVVYFVTSMTYMRIYTVTGNTYFALIAGTSLGMIHRTSADSRTSH